MLKMKKILQNEFAKSIISLALFVIIVFGIIFFLDWLNVPNPIFWRFVLYALLIVLGVPLWIETHFHNKLRREHDQLSRDLDWIRKDFENFQNRIIRHKAKKKVLTKIKKIYGRKRKLTK